MHMTLTPRTYSAHFPFWNTIITSMSSVVTTVRAYNIVVYTPKQVFSRGQAFIHYTIITSPCHVCNWGQSLFQAWCRLHAHAFNWILTAYCLHTWPSTLEAFSKTVRNMQKKRRLLKVLKLWVNRFNVAKAYDACTLASFSAFQNSPKLMSGNLKDGWPICKNVDLYCSCVVVVNRKINFNQNWRSPWKKCFLPFFTSLSQLWHLANLISNSHQRLSYSKVLV